VIQELGAEEGLALYKQMFDLHDGEEVAEDFSVVEGTGLTGDDQPAVRPDHRSDRKGSRASLDDGPQNEQRSPDLPPDELQQWLRLSEAVPGTTRGELAHELASTSLSLPPDPIIIEIGAFMGSGTVLLAGPRKMRGSGKVHCVDPFDCSGDPRSTPIYERVLEKAGGGSLLDHFVDNIRHAGLSGWVEVHQGRAAEIAANWTSPVDMIYIDLDVSGEAAGEAYDSWCQFLKPGGVIVVHNSDPDDNRPDSPSPIEERIHPPHYTDIRVVDGNTFARKT
jgi:predicted O-methyltransferase YrrM